MNTVSDNMTDTSTYLQDINEAIDSIETQPTYPAEDVHVWMKSWGSENELPSPRTSVQSNKV